MKEKLPFDRSVIFPRKFHFHAPIGAITLAMSFELFERTGRMYWDPLHTCSRSTQEDIKTKIFLIAFIHNQLNSQADLSICYHTVYNK